MAIYWECIWLLMALLLFTSASIRSERLAGTTSFGLLNGRGLLLLPAQVQIGLLTQSGGIPALVLYGLLGLLAGYGLMRVYLKQQETNQLRALDAMKTRFFTNITHEFRTPLTLILAPAEQLKQRLHHPDDQRQLTIISHYATQLLGLINQLMDLSKAEAHALRVNESQGNLGEFLTQLVQSFEPQASANGVQMIVRVEEVGSYYWFDSEKLERIVLNLVANALKFTPMGGRVVVSLTAHPDHELAESPLQLTVADNGVGIAPEQLDHIFDRFYQADYVATSESAQPQPEGTGIGLALVKELVEVQNGTIGVASKVSIGTTFTLTLPYRPAIAPAASVRRDSRLPATSPLQATNGIETDETPVILLVEDNPDLSDFIAGSLPVFYQIHRAANGFDGFGQAVNLIPDLVISDVLMPVMDGYTLCQQLKQDDRTSHVPVILLTAKASVDSRLEGLAQGADDYITKPFHVRELLLRVHNLLEQRRQLQKWTLASVTNPDPVPAAPSPPDPLLDKLCQLVEQHLDQTAFGVEELTVASGLSRMNLHRKLKALTGTSAGEFIRNYRLKRAAQLLRQGHSVSETAYLVGFEDPSYFARSFRKVYQISPSAFASTNT